MAMRAALRCLSANFSPRLPQLSAAAAAPAAAAQLSATRLLWRSGSPRTLSTTSALSSGNETSKRSCYILHAGDCSRIPVCVLWAKKKKKKKEKRSLSLSLSGAEECDREGG